MWSTDDVLSHPVVIRSALLCVVCNLFPAYHSETCSKPRLHNWGGNHQLLCMSLQLFLSLCPKWLWDLSLQYTYSVERRKVIIFSGSHLANHLKFWFKLWGKVVDLVINDRNGEPLIRSIGSKPFKIKGNSTNTHLIAIYTVLRILHGKLICSKKLTLFLGP